ncbi:MAG: hypothetical protein EXR09_11855 [Acetobacteraceae bacterium]|nr:hypothetical protein [Acetobacteraceae bacterium]
MPRGALIVALDFTACAEDEFHDWYDTEHLPERQRIDGFGVCERWISIANPKIGAATYDLDSADLLTSPAYQAIAGDNLSPWSKRLGKRYKRLQRSDGDQTNPGNALAPAGAGGLLINAMNVAPEHEADFNAWYDQEHLPALSKVPGTILARRFKSRAGSHKFLALYHLTTPEVVTTDAWKEAVNTPWTARVRPTYQDHFRIVLRPYKRGA